MLIVISWFISCLLFNIMYCEIFNNIHECKKKLSFKDYILIIVIAIIDGYTIYLDIRMRTMIIFVSFFVLLKLTFRKEIGNTLLTTFIIQILFAIGEMLFVVFSLLVINLDAKFLTESFIGILITNISIVLIVLLILKIKLIRIIIESIIKWYKSQNIINLILTILIGLTTILFLLYQNLNGIDNVFDFILNNIFVVGISYFITCFFIERSSYNRIKHKYDNLMDYAKTYEQEVVEKSKWQHEYQNQLIIVKSKISKTNKEAQKYIDNLLKNQPVDINSQWLSKLSKFPDIGIKGLICYKIGQMQAKGINVFVDVTSDLKLNKNQCRLLEKNLQDISRVLGVYLDNAIDAASKTLKKYIVLEINADKDKLVFEISNTFTGSLNFEKIDNEKFTTKGKGHGYGLSLVKDILSKNNLLSQEREINGMYYVQKLIIDIKNKSF